MKITEIKIWSENLELSRPYTIAYETIDFVENIFVYLETDNGLFGLGSGSPVEFITGESMAICKLALESHLEDILLGEDPRLVQKHIRLLENVLDKMPAARAAADIALHDLLGKVMHLPLVDLLGRAHESLPTSITIGIKSMEESVAEAEEYLGRGFRILKVKTGHSVDVDIERVIKIREKLGSNFAIRVDANQGYNVPELNQFVAKTMNLDIEFIEQPLKKENVEGMFQTSEQVRKMCCADESLHNPIDALKLASHPAPFGIFNIKLMKCGGILPGLKIAEIANLAGIDLMWGCMDESIISISAALHAAMASPRTRYLDLDGSLDLARDLVKEGFILKDGHLSVNNKNGLGITLLNNIKI